MLVFSYWAFFSSLVWTCGRSQVAFGNKTMSSIGTKMIGARKVGGSCNALLQMMLTSTINRAFCLSLSEAKGGGRYPGN